MNYTESQPAFRLVFLAFSLTALLFAAGCRSTTPPASAPVVGSISIPATDFEQSSLTVLTQTLPDEGEVVVTPDSAGWLSYRVHIPVAGRYRFSIRLAPAGSKPLRVWLEAYPNNPDDRTYNITGEMQKAAPDGESGFATLTKDGSPLDSGMHELRLHVSEGGAMLGRLEFELLRAHQLTPVILTQNTTGETWKLAWSDEFDGSGLPDTTKWTYDIGNWGWGNNEPQYYTVNRLENARQEGGNLIIESHKNDMGKAWTSARLTTRGKQSFLYGRIEFRAIAPAGGGTWAAGWLLGDAYRDELSWPYCGEIDVMECVGNEFDEKTGKGINHASCHTRAYYFKQGNHLTRTIEVENMTTEFHTYSIEWLPTGVTAYLDSVPYYTYDKLNGDWEWPFGKPQNLLINLAMGGGMGGDIDPTIQSQQLIVDYVRVYELH